MKVTNSPNFGSKILYGAKLKESNFWSEPKSINIVISELDKSDANIVDSIKPFLWCTTHGGQALCAFRNECKKPLYELGFKKRFIVVESPQTMTSDRYKGIAEIDNNTNYLLVKRLQSLRPFPAYQNIKGIGSCIMYGIFQMAKKLNKEYVELTSIFDATDFYRKIGMKQDHYKFKINNADFDTVTKTLEDKFNIQEFQA